jgi:hypothetical protein
MDSSVEINLKSITIDVGEIVDELEYSSCKVQ